MPKVYLIHERPDEKDTAPRPSKYVFRSQRIGNRIRIEPWTLVGDADNQRVRRRLKRGRNVLGRVVRVAMKYSVDSRFPHGHGDMRNRVFVETGPLCDLLGG